MNKVIYESLKKIKRGNPLGVSNKVIVSNIKELIKKGLAAGDHSRPYVTDKGDLYLADPEKAEFMEASRS